ncbi:MAG: YkgJ family cysteine cluster protein [Myxococcaceae bacterium]
MSRSTLGMARTGDLETDRRLRTRARRAALQELAAVYRGADAAYRPYSCPGTGECCQLATTKHEPWLWPIEWEALLAAKGGQLPSERADGGCPFLAEDGKRCSVYTARPFGCRTFFCHRIQGPAREPVDAVAGLSARLERVAQTHEPDCPGPRPLLAWARDAWHQAEARSGAVLEALR